MFACSCLTKKVMFLTVILLTYRELSVLLVNVMDCSEVC